MAWLIDEPMRPMPISATRSNIGLRHAGRPPEEVGERRDDRAVVGLGADGHAQGSGRP